MNSKENFEEFWEVCFEFLCVSKPSVIGLWSVSKIRNEGLIGPWKNWGILYLVPDKPQGHGIKVNVAVWLQCEMNEDLCLLWWRFLIVQLVYHPVSVEEVESVDIHALRSSSLYTLELLTGDKYRAIRFRIVWPEQDIFLYGVEVVEGSFAISRVNYITII